MRARLAKGRNAFRTLRNIWRISNTSENIKMKFVKNSVLSKLLYVTEKITGVRKKLEVFQRKGLLKHFWPNVKCNIYAMKISI